MFLALAGALLAGCGGSSSDGAVGASIPSAASPLPVAAVSPGTPTVSALMPAATGGSLKLGGFVVTVPANALSADATLSLSLDTATDQPVNRIYATQGQRVRLDLGGARLLLPFQVTASGTAGSFLTLHTAGRGFTYQTSSVNGTALTAQLDVDPAGNPAQLAVVQDKSGQRPAHVPWGTYHLFRYDSASRAFQPFAGGDVGATPVMLVRGLGSGFGADSPFPKLAQHLIDADGASAVIGFEYDLLDSVANSGGLLRSALSGADWRVVAHSTGGLVARSAGATRLVTLATPHQGTLLANLMQGPLGPKVHPEVTLQLNSRENFTNVDGKICEVKTTEAGFTDLRTDASIPSGSYAALAGTSTGVFAFLDKQLGVTTADGVATQASATAGALATGAAPLDHYAMAGDATLFPLLDPLLTR